MVASSLSNNDSWSCFRRAREATNPAPAVAESCCRTLWEAEELFDWLEANGHSGSKLVLSDRGFIVRAE
jgi:hypothetical protein